MVRLTLDNDYPQQPSSNENDNRRPFDMNAEVERLKEYHLHLQAEKKKEKARIQKQQFQSLYGNDRNQYFPRHLHLYRMGKNKIKIRKGYSDADNSKETMGEKKRAGVLVSSHEEEMKRLNSLLSASTTTDVGTRLYERSTINRVTGKERRETIEKANAKSNALRNHQYQRRGRAGSIGGVQGEVETIPTLSTSTSNTSSSSCSGSHSSNGSGTHSHVLPRIPCLVKTTTPTTTTNKNITSSSSRKEKSVSWSLMSNDDDGYVNNTPFQGIENTMQCSV